MSRESLEDEEFACNICFEKVVRPVVTRCGHLFCWQCISVWLERGAPDCPVCKSPVTRATLIPIYGRGVFLPSDTDKNHEPLPNSVCLSDNTMDTQDRNNSELFVRLGFPFGSRSFSPSDRFRDRLRLNQNEMRQQAGTRFLIFLGVVLIFMIISSYIYLHVFLQFYSVWYMKFFDFLKGKSKPKPHEIIRHLSSEMKALRDNEINQNLRIGDDECNELENYLAAACAGCTANVYIKKQPKPEEVERCLGIAESSDIMKHISMKIAWLRPETRRSVCAIWGYLLKMEHPKSFQRPMVEYLIKNLSMIDSLLLQYGHCTTGADVIIGVMIRDATRFQRVIEYIYRHDLVLKLLPVLRSSNFDVSADGFQTLREILTNHKEISSLWLNKNFDRFFTEYMVPIQSGADYVTIRQSLSVLSILLLDRQFMDTMIQFVSREEYLKAVLVLLGNESRIIGFEAFNIFKIFAVNPQKPPKIIKLLSQNHARIVKLLNHIDQDRADDVEFKQDKHAVIMKLDALKPPSERSQTEQRSL